jgi:hypothetical protein
LVNTFQICDVDIEGTCTRMGLELTNAYCKRHIMIAGYTEGSLAWSVEQAKLLWAQGQQAVAVRMSKSLLEVARHNKAGNVVAYARLLSLTGKWLAETR